MLVFTKKYENHIQNTKHNVENMMMNENEMFLIFLAHKQERKTNLRLDI